MAKNHVLLLAWLVNLLTWLIVQRTSLFQLNPVIIRICLLLLFESCWINDQPEIKEEIEKSYLDNLLNPFSFLFDF